MCGPVKDKELHDAWKYAFECWKEKFVGFEPVELVATHNNAGDYEKSEMHVFKLKRGYALVYEYGCSCYERADAQMDFFKNKPTLLESLRTKIQSATYESREIQLMKTIMLKMMRAIK